MKARDLTLKKYKNIHTGNEYGNWIVLNENDYEQKNGYKKFLCQCQCINKTKKYVDERNLKNGSSVCCGKCSHKPIQIGDIFGNWTALENETQNRNILCKCSCGTKKNVNKNNLLKGTSNNCGCLRSYNHFAKNQYTNDSEDIIIGNKYHKWTVLKKVKSNSYLCECSCFYHTKKILKRCELLGESKHNGCKKCRLMKNHINETHGYLTILSIDEKKTIEKGRTYVNAKCKCGNIHSYEQHGIIKGRIVSCGCKKHEIDSNLVGERFGYLTVTKLVGRKYIKNNSKESYIEWECICDCGKKTIVRQGNLIHGSTLSCGCMKRSHGEELIFKFLKQHHFIFKEQYRINDCRNILPLPFDFALFDKNKNLLGLIEFDGQQHFTTFQFNSCDKNVAIQNLYQTIKRDEIKTNYCFDKKIKLLRITYEDLDDGNWIYMLWDFLCELNLIIDKK